MGQHFYENPGPREANVRTNIGGVVAMPLSTTVELRDGAEKIELCYTDLDTVNETIRLFIEARAKHVGAMVEGRSEEVPVDQLDADQMVVLDGEIVAIDTVVLTDTEAFVRFARKSFDDGTLDYTDTASVRVPRSRKVTRLLPTVAAVQ